MWVFYLYATTYCIAYFYLNPNKNRISYFAMDIIEYTEDKKVEWEQFLDNSNNGTLFSSQDFFAYHPANRFKNRHLMFYKRNKLVSLFPSAEYDRNGKRFLVSHPGASFGGFVSRTKTGVEEALELVKSLIKYARQNNYEGIEITRPPWVYYEFPEDHIDFALFKAGAIHRKRELTAVVPIYENIDENLKLLRPTARTSMRKAIKKGVEISQSDDIESFYHILEKNLSLRHNVEPTHSLEELYRLQELIGDRIKLFSAFHQDNMIAGTLLFICNTRTVLAFYISQDYEHQKLRPLNLLFVEIFRWCSDNGFRWLDFGTYTLNNVPNLGLARFKESLGAKGIFRDTLTFTF